MDRGWDTEFAALLKKIGGRWSGPAAELVLSFFKTLKMISGEIVISERGGLDGGKWWENAVVMGKHRVEIFIHLFSFDVSMEPSGLCKGQSQIYYLTSHSRICKMHRYCLRLNFVFVFSVKLEDGRLALLTDGGIFEF